MAEQWDLLLCSLLTDHLMAPLNQFLFSSCPETFPTRWYCFKYLLFHNVVEIQSTDPKILSRFNFYHPVFCLLAD